MKVPEKVGRVFAVQLLAGTVFILGALVAIINNEDSATFIVVGLALMAIAPLLKYLPD